MKILALSDTHNRHLQLELPECDILIHAGDATNDGRPDELMYFLDWLSKQPAKYKIFVPGNHDRACEMSPDYFQMKCEDRGISFLIDNMVELDGLKVWGSPYTPTFGRWAFQYRTLEDAMKHWALIPSGLDILITHGPPYGMLDETYIGPPNGCNMLLYKILETKPKAHIFGHIHEAYGQRVFNDIKFYNVACGGKENPPTEIFL